MAITSAIMQMRRGNEADFDPDKMHPGEWAVSTDEKYVRMCFSPGVCVRMATYEAFEEDMEQIISILEEAKTVQEAIEKIYEEFQKAELDIEAAENSATLSESYAHGGTGTREGEDTDNAKYYAEKAKENIEPAMNAVSDIALNRQTLGYTKKNLFKLVDGSETVTGVGFIQNSSNGTVIANGTATETTIPRTLQNANGRLYLKAGTYILSGCPSGGAWNVYCLGITIYSSIKNHDVYEYGNSTTFTITQEEENVGAYILLAPIVFAGNTVDNLTFRPMVRSADIEDDTFEPYVDDVDTRLKALTPVNNLLATVPGSPLDAAMGKMLNDMIVALEERFKRKMITVPTPILEEDGYTRTYEIDLSSYTEVEVTLFVKGYGEVTSYRCFVPVGNNYTAFNDEYTDDNSYVWASSVRVYNNKIVVKTLSNSTNPSTNYIVISTIYAR